MSIKAWGDHKVKDLAGFKKVLREGAGAGRRECIAERKERAEETPTLWQRKEALLLPRMFLANRAHPHPTCRNPGGYHA